MSIRVCRCSQILTIKKDMYHCSNCNASEPIPSGTLILSSESVVTEVDNKKELIYNNVNPMTYRKCATCNDVTKHRVIISDNNYVQHICTKC